MIIQRIRIENFRGFTYKEIDFENKPVVLLSAANGVGKTTTIDAIEWCLTGNIGRLKTAYKARSTNSVERQKNNNGILKNRDAKSTQMIKVTLWLSNGDEEIKLCREQKKDELEPNLSTVMLEGSEDKAKKFIEEYVGNSFYNYHFCDVQKSFNVQSTKRTDLKELFSEFITNYDSQLQIANNLKIFADDVKRYIEDKEKLKVSQQVIDHYKDELRLKRVHLKTIEYPEIMFYPSETLDVSGLNESDLIAQKEKIIVTVQWTINEPLFSAVNFDCFFV